MLVFVRSHLPHALDGLVQDRQVAFQGLPDLLLSLPALDGGPGLFQDDEGVQGVAVGGIHDARIDDVQTQQVQGLDAPGEDIVVVAHVDEQFGGAALGAVPQQDQGQGGLAVFQRRLGVPGDLVGPVADEIIVAEAGPGPFDAGLPVPALLKQRQGLGFRFPHQGLFVDGVFQPAPQGGRGLGVEFG